MTKWQIRKLARACIKAGPAITHDGDGNGYLSYVAFVREGMRYAVMVVDKDIAELNNTTLEFIEAEIRAVLDNLKAMPLNTSEARRSM